jgi:hypothetical protein
VGAVTATGGANAPLAGVAASAAAGAAMGSIPVSASLTGVEAHALAQAPTVTIQSIAGVAAQAGVGSVTVTAGNSAFGNPVGLQATAGIGNLAVTLKSVDGVAASSAVGALGFRAAASASIVGLQTASAAGQAIGDVTVDFANIPGLEASTAAGAPTVTAGAHVPLSGISASAAAGSVKCASGRFSLFVAGVDRTHMLHLNSLSANRDITGQTAAQFVLYDRLGRYVPRDGEEVLYYFLGRRVFGGLVQKSEMKCLESRTETLTTVNCVGYQQILQDRTYTNVFRGPTIDLKTVVQDIVAVGLSGEVIRYPSDSETSTIDAKRFTFSGDTVYASLQKVAKDFGYNFWVDNDAVIHMERVAWKPAPYTIRDQTTQSGQWRQMKVTRDASRVTNTIGTRGAIPLAQTTATTKSTVATLVDSALIFARKGRVGGSGIVEEVTTVRNVVDAPAAAAINVATQNRYGKPITTIEFESDLPFWEIGQVVHLFTTAPAAAGLFQIRALSFREINLAFLRYTVHLQAPELPVIEGILVEDNGDGSNTLTVDFGRPVDFGPGDPFNLSGTGLGNGTEPTGSGGFGEDAGTRITAIRAHLDGGSWVVNLTVEALYVKPGETIRISNVRATALGGHGIAFGAPVDRINGDWNLHGVDIPAKILEFRTGVDENPVVDFTDLVYLNAPDGIYFGSQHLNGLDGNWLTNGSGLPNENSVQFFTGQALHIESVQFSSGGTDENDWIVQLNVDHVPTLVYKTGANVLMPQIHAFTITGMQSDLDGFEHSNAVVNYSAAQKTVLTDSLRNGLNGTWTSYDVGVAPDMWIRLRTSSAPNKKLNMNQFRYQNSPNATIFFFGDDINPPVDLPPGPVDLPASTAGYTGIPPVPGETGAINNSGVGLKVFTIVDVNNTTREVTTHADHGFTTSYPDYSGSVVRIFGVTEPRELNNFPVRITVTGARTFIAEDGLPLNFAAHFINDGHGQVTATGARVNLASGPADVLNHLLGLTSYNEPVANEKATFLIANAVPGLPVRPLVVADDVTNPYTVQSDIGIVDSVYARVGTPGMGDVGVGGSGDIQIDVTRNGTSIFPGGSYLTIPGGSTDGVTVRGFADAPSPTYVEQGDEINTSVKKVGTTFPGCNLVVLVNMKGA